MHIQYTYMRGEGKGFGNVESSGDGKRIRKWKGRRESDSEI